MEHWLDNLDKKLTAEATVAKALKLNHAVHQKELTETLEEFKNALNYHKRFDEY